MPIKKMFKEQFNNIKKKTTQESRTVRMNTNAPKKVKFVYNSNEFTCGIDPHKSNCGDAIEY